MCCTGKLPAKPVGTEDKHDMKAVGWPAAEERGVVGMFECAAFFQQIRSTGRINRGGKLSTTKRVLISVKYVVATGVYYR